MRESADNNGDATTAERVADLEVLNVVNAARFRGVDFAILKLNWKLWFLIFVTGGDVAFRIYERLAG